MVQQPEFHRETLAIVTGRPPRDVDEPLNVPVHLASTYVSGGDREYGRYANPSWTAFEDALGALEGGRCVSFASGIAAISAVLDLVEPGGIVVAPRRSYTGTVGQLDDRAAAGRLTVRYVDIADTDEVAAASDGAAMVWIESPTNPALELADIPAISRGAHDRGAIVVVDNTFATPLLQQPLEQGADIVVHSATKYISGHSDALLGAVITSDDAHHDRIVGRRSLYGAIPAPLEAFLALRGLRTLPVRLRARAGDGAGARAPPRRSPGARRGAVPGVRSDHLDRDPRGSGCRGCGDRSRPIVGACDEPRRSRIDVGTSPSVARRAADDSRGTRAPLGRTRTRR